MGICSSCCGRRRRRKVHDPEREPLIREAERTGKTLADVLAALRTGKIPSQEQLNTIIRNVLRSQALNETRKLSERGKKIVEETKEVLQRVLEFGLEKNYDDLLQDLLYELSQVDPSEAIASGKNVVERVAENVDEVAHDTKSVILSFGTLFRLAFTSAAFRLVASSLALLIRDAITKAAEEVQEVAEAIEDAAGRVEQVAQGVEKAAEDVEEAVQDDRIVDLDVRETAKEVLEDVRVGTEHGKRPPKVPMKDGPEPTVEDVVVSQIQEILKEAQRDPRCLSALLTIIGTCQRLAKPWRGPDRDLDIPSPSGAPKSPEVQMAKTFLERLVPKQSLRFVYGSLTAHQRDIRKYLRRVRDFLVAAMADPGYASSSAGHRDLQDLVDRGRRLVRSLKGLRELVTAIQADPTTKKLSTSVHTLFADVLDYISTSSPALSETAGSFGEDLWGDLKGYFIPLILKTVWRMQSRKGPGVPVPLPRVEFVDPSVKGAVDARMMWAQARSVHDEEETEDTGNLLLPSTVRMQRREDTLVDLRGTGTTLITSSTAHLSIHEVFAVDGELRLNGIQYFADYKDLYVDEGKLDLILRGGRGIDVEMTLRGWDVEGVKVHMSPGLVVRPRFVQSRHQVINKLLVEPFTPLIVRRVFQSILEGWIRALAERICEAKRTGDWWFVLSSSESQDDSSTNVNITLGGVEFVPEGGDTAIAVGAVPQLLPANAIPSPPAVDEVAEQARSSLQGAEQAAVDVGHDVRDVYDERRALEGTTGGWRSDAFDI